MPASVTPLRPPVSRTSETARPISGARLKSSAPMLPPPPLSVAERHQRDEFPCQVTTCTASAEVTARGKFEGVEVVSMLCRSCAKHLPAHARPVPLSKVFR